MSLCARDLPDGTQVEYDGTVWTAHPESNIPGDRIRWHSETSLASNRGMDGMLDDGARVLSEVPAAQEIPEAAPLVLAPDAREKLARHLYADHDVRIPPWERTSPLSKGQWLKQADELLAVITGKEG